MDRLRVLMIADPGTVHTQRLMQRLSARPDIALAHFWRVQSKSFDLGANIRSFALQRTARVFPGYWRMREFFSFAKAVRGWRPQLVHVQAHPEICARVRRFGFPGPVVFTSWGHLSPEDRSAAWVKGLQAATAITGDSEPLLDELRSVPSMSGRDGLLMRFAADLETFSAGEPDPDVHSLLNASPEDVVLYSARSLQPEYNHDVCIEAFAAVLRRHPRARLVLKNHHAWRHAESEDYSAKLHAQAARLGVEPRVTWLDHLDYSRLAGIYRRAMITLSIPSVDGFPATIAEAMACGSVPVVGDLPDYRGFVENGVNALTVSPRSAEEVAGAILRLMDDEPLRRTLAANAVRTARDKGDFARETGRLVEFYHRLAGK